jgi:Na+-driven multidrug efflux pump
MLEWGVMAGVVFGVLLVAADPLLTRIFTSDGAVRDELMVVLIAVAGMQPLAGAVFVLDGILIGAGDTKFLALAMAAATTIYLPFAIWVLVADAGLLALWGAIYVFMLGRLLGMAMRYRRDAWLVTGAVRT